MTFIPDTARMKHGMGSTKGRNYRTPSAPKKPSANKPKNKNKPVKNAASPILNTVAKNENLSIRKISNGYITSSSTYNKKEGYKETQVYTEAHPVTGKK